MAIMAKLGEVVVKRATQKIKKTVEGIGYMAHTEVVIGITKDSDVGRESGITNSELLYLQENGVPSHNIPPRPVIKPALAQDEIKDKIKKLRKEAWKAALLEGDTDKAEMCLEKAGMVGRDACKAWITDGTHLTPNAESTIRRKGSSIPLIDSASMMNSISYEVRKK